MTAVSQAPFGFGLSAVRQLQLASTLLPFLAILSGCYPSQALAALPLTHQYAAAILALLGMAGLLMMSGGSLASADYARPAPIDAIGRLLTLAASRPDALPDGSANAVVMIAYYYPPDNEIGAARPHRFARYLRRQGADVAVVCSGGMLRRAEDRQALAEMQGAEPLPRRVPDAGASRLTRILSAMLHAAEHLLLPYHDRLGWLPHAYAAAHRSLTRHAVILSTHPPIVTHLTAMMLKLRTGRPWVADFRDPLWGNPTRTSERAAMMDPFTERMVLKLADAVIANTDSAAALLRRRYPAMAEKIHTIWNGFDPDDVIVPLPRASGGRLVVSHVGTLYGARTPLPFLLSLQRLINSGADAMRFVQFRQIGRIEPGSFEQANPALEQLESLGCLHRSARHLRQAEARQEMLNADILLLLDMNDANPGLQVPAKLYDYVRTGRPILALTPAGSATSRVLAYAGVPHACIDLGAPVEVIDAAVLEFLTSEHEQASPSALFLREFSAIEQVKALAAIVDSARIQKAAEPERGRVVA